MQLSKISKKLNIKEPMLKEIIFQHHNINHLLSKKETKSIPLELTGTDLLQIRKIAKALKVDPDAVITGLLLAYMDGEQK